MLMLKLLCGGTQIDRRQTTIKMIIIKMLNYFLNLFNIKKEKALYKKNISAM